MACVGPGGCSSGQVCNAAGTGYGPCDCAPVEAGSPCVPGQSVACVGPGGCLSDQVCNAAGTGYGGCTCPDTDGAILVCIPGQSIACTGQGGCFASQVCNAEGTALGPCVCPDGGSVECMTANDCATLLGPVPPICLVCPKGAMGCAHYECVTGICQTTYCD